MFKADVPRKSKVTPESRKEQVRRASQKYATNNRMKRNKSNLMTRVRLGHMVKDETLVQYGLDPQDDAFVEVAPGLKIGRYVQKPIIKGGTVSSQCFDVTASNELPAQHEV